MTELMKRYKAETGKKATYRDIARNELQYDFISPDYCFWCAKKIDCLEDENAKLEAQLTWRSAINEPPENEGQQLCRWSWQDNCHFRNYDLRFGWGNVTEKEIKDLLWLPIPKEATDD